MNNDIMEIVYIIGGVEYEDVDDLLEIESEDS